MRITEQEYEIGGNKKKRIVFAVGYEDIEILHAILEQAVMYYPKRKDLQTYRRIKGMVRGLSNYLGLTQPRPSRTDTGTKCPICDRKLFGQHGIEMHMKMVHPDKTEKEGKT